MDADPIGVPLPELYNSLIDKLIADYNRMLTANRRRQYCTAACARLGLKMCVVRVQCDTTDTFGGSLRSLVFWLSVQHWRNRPKACQSNQLAR